MALQVRLRLLRLIASPKNLNGGREKKCVLRDLTALCALCFLGIMSSERLLTAIACSTLLPDTFCPIVILSDTKMSVEKYSIIWKFTAGVFLPMLYIYQMLVILRENVQVVTLAWTFTLFACGVIGSTAICQLLWRQRSFMGLLFFITKTPKIWGVPTCAPRFFRLCPVLRFKVA